MKYHKMFCIDGEIAEKLKGTNASELVNSLLDDYFKLSATSRLSIEDKKRLLELIREENKKKEELKILETKAQEIRNGN